MELAFHEKLRQGFLSIAKNDPDRCAVIDASNNIDDVHEKIMDTVKERNLIQ